MEAQKPSEESTDQAVSPAAGINGHLIESKKTRSDEGELENGVHELAKSPTPETAVDGDGDVSMAVREEAQEHLLPTLGPSVGVQISPAKAADLSPDTAILHVAADDHVTRTLWRPHDPTIFVVAGEHFCSIWKLSSSSAPVEVKLVENDDETSISAVSWDPTGQKLAVATYSDLIGTVSIYNVKGYALDLLPEFPRLITGLYWTPIDNRLVFLASNGKITEVVVWDAYGEVASPEIIDGVMYDLSWAGSNRAYLCGAGPVYQCDLVDGGLRVSQTFRSDSPNTTWTFIKCTNAGDSSIAVAASSDMSALWIPTHDMCLDDAHQGSITAMELHAQPQTWSPLQKNQRIILATFSTDNTVKLWNIDLEEKRFDCVHRLSLGPSMPALAGGLSPDGYALAASSKDRLFIWNAERGGNAMATWTMPGSEVKTEEGPDRVVNGQNGIAETPPDRSLSWDTDGKKLAIGFGKQVCSLHAPMMVEC